jgi:hypothetical protein
MTFVAVTMLLVGIVGLALTHRRSAPRPDRTLRSQPPRRRAADSAVVRDLESIALKVRDGAPLSRRDRKRAAALVRELERR